MMEIGLETLLHLHYNGWYMRHFNTSSPRTSNSTSTSASSSTPTAHTPWPSSSSSSTVANSHSRLSTGTSTIAEYHYPHIIPQSNDTDTDIQWSADGNYTSTQGDADYYNTSDFGRIFYWTVDRTSHADADADRQRRNNTANVHSGIAAAHQSAAGNLSSSDYYILNITDDLSTLPTAFPMINTTQRENAGTATLSLLPDTMDITLYNTTTNITTNDTCVWSVEDMNLWATIACVLIVAGFLGNLLVCMAIITERRLQSPTTKFLFSLAVADLFVSVFVMPLGIVVEIYGGSWPLDFSMCVLYNFSDITGCTASIMHMCFISIDRYLGISRPLKQRNRSNSVIHLKIAFVWIITLAISSPVIFVSLHDPSNVLPTPCLCTMDNQYIMVAGSFTAFFLPLAVMAFMMGLTVKLLREQARWSEGKREAGGAVSRSRTAIKRRPQERAPPERCKARYRSDSNSGEHRRSNGNVGVSHNEESSASDISPDEPLATSNSPTRSSKGVSKMQAAVNLFNRRRQKKLSAQKVDSEKKATKVLSIVFALFVACWTPFFVNNLWMGACLFNGYDCSPKPIVLKVFLWLGWASSIVNPVVYTVVNPLFRKAFFRLLCCPFSKDAGQQCRRQLQRTVQNCREWSSLSGSCSTTGCTGGPSNNKRAILLPNSDSTHFKPNVKWNPTFLTALALDNETPV
ncbi:5-hydroxytryptamine receptor 2A-like [Paramacrobiotus metropolitanus]|uniref:5-hydroxytryptamine receptor 2A-like n=1 Tax=Paramacrobiotus metropolitanus TaxID=2943436 RepID=UPI0024461613|nr:5-hydroxytryptamine receptor 2A-like [Paramacrobiotus metropolitanus]XP_055331944.1 5-hydroxytryptamine receptor 2A-like [Paramacrobiotus metropolitanus]